MPQSAEYCARIGRARRFGRQRRIKPRTAEARCRRGLRHAIQFDERIARAVVRMPRRLIHRQHRREAGVAALQQATPFIARAGAEAFSEACLRFRPPRAIHLRRHRRGVDLEQAQQFGVELGLDRGHRDITPVSAFVDLVEVGARVGHVAAAPAIHPSGRLGAVDRGHQRGRAVDHGGVHHLALSRPLRLDDGGKQADNQVQRAAAEIADQVERRCRRSALAADRVQRTGERDVVEVVSRCVRERPLLAPAGDAAEHETRVAGKADRPGPGRAAP